MSFDIYRMITDRIIEQLQQGVIPWKKPWIGARVGAYSHMTGEPYGLLNQMLLARPGEYITRKSCMEEGGHPKKGSKASVIIYVKPITKEVEGYNGAKEEETYFMRRYYRVFHIDDCIGIEARYPAKDTYYEHQPIEHAQRIAEQYLYTASVLLEHQRCSEATYSPIMDRIIMPMQYQFADSISYYSTLFHEMAHSTGHESRLNRTMSLSMKSSDYAKEELIAELTTAAMLNDLGIETPSSFRTSAAYIASWISHLDNDPRFIVNAASNAEKAFSLISDPALFLSRTQQLDGIESEMEL